MPQRSSTIPPKLSPVLQRARADISGSLVQCLRDVGVSIAAAARWMGVHEKTVRLWIKGKRPVNVERVTAVRGLRRAFKLRFCAEDHDVRPAYVARKSASSNKKRRAKTRRGWA